MYSVISKIGNGSYGEVWKCKNKRDGEIVAIKSMKVEGELSPSCIKEFVFSSIDHPNIIRTRHQFFNISNNSKSETFYVKVMDCTQTDLSNLLFTSEMSTKELPIYEMTNCMLRGVGMLHSNNIVHMDLKPDNILVDVNFVLKIADLGSCEMEGNDNSKRVGTFHWMAPELNLWVYHTSSEYGLQIPTKKHTSLIDSWSVGVIMCEMLMRRKMFWYETKKQMSHDHYHVMKDGVKQIENYPFFYVKLISHFLTNENQRWRILDVINKKQFDTYKIIESPFTYFNSSRNSSNSHTNHSNQLANGIYHEYTLARRNDLLPFSRTGIKNMAQLISQKLFQGFTSTTRSKNYHTYYNYQNKYNNDLERQLLKSIPFLRLNKKIKIKKTKTNKYSINFNNFYYYYWCYFMVWVWWIISFFQKK